VATFWGENYIICSIYISIWYRAPLAFREPIYIHEWNVPEWVIPKHATREHFILSYYRVNNEYHNIAWNLRNRTTARWKRKFIFVWNKKRNSRSFINIRINLTGSESDLCNFKSARFYNLSPIKVSKIKHSNPNFWRIVFNLRFVGITRRIIVIFDFKFFVIKRFPRLLGWTRQKWFDRFNLFSRKTLLSYKSDLYTHAVIRDLTNAVIRDDRLKTSACPEKSGCIRGKYQCHQPRFCCDT
jgi:hypothetical protein